MRAKVKFSVVAPQTWFFYKRFQAALEGLHIDSIGMKKLKETLCREDLHVILMPMY